MKCVFKHQDLQMFGPKFDKYLLFTQLKLWVKVASHNFKWVIFLIQRFNPFKPEFPIAIFIHYKPRIAVAILDL